MIASIPFRRTLPRNSVKGSDPGYWVRPRGTWGGMGTAPSQFPSANPGGSSSPFVNAMATSIASQEGYGAANSACSSINNPGCLRAGPGQIGTSPQGYAIFPDPATGWTALDTQIQSNINLGVDMTQFFAGESGVYPGYAPSADSNNPVQYASNVASSLSVPASGTPLSQLQAAYDISTSGGTTAPDMSSDTYGLADSVDLSGSVDMTPFLVAAGVLAVALIMR